MLVVLISLIGYVTGIAGALLVVFALLCGVVFGRISDELLGPIQWMCGIVASTLYLAFFLAWNDDVIHWFNPFSPGPNSQRLPYYSIPYQPSPLPVDPLTRMRVFSGVIFPMLLIIFFLLWRKGKPRLLAVRRQNYTMIIAVLIPTILASVVKFRNNFSLLAPAMSGDSRNHLLLTQTIRLSGELVIGRAQWGVPKFANGIAAWLSAGNGASGVLERADVAGISAVYFISFIALSAVFSAGILLAANYSLVSRHAQTAISGLAIISVFGVLSAFVMGNILLDGFLSLSLGVVLLAISLVIGMKAIEKPNLLMFAVLCAVAVLMLNAYTFIGLPCIAILFIVVLRGAQKKSQTRRWWLAVLITGCTLGAYILVFIATDYWDTFTKGVSLAGSVAVMQPEISWALMAIGVGGVIGAFIGIPRAVTAPTIISMATAFVTIRLIESVPGNGGPGLSYYSQKAFLGIVIANIWVFFIPLIPALVVRAEQWRQFSLVRRWGQGSLEILSMAAIPLLVVGLLSPLPSTTREIWRGWWNPDALNVPMILDEWEKGDDYIFWRATEDLERFTFPAPWADRIANFWSPATWDSMSVRGMGELWNWIYFQVNSDDPALLCAPLQKYPLRVITRDPLLEEQVLAACGKNQATFDLRPRRVQ